MDANDIENLERTPCRLCTCVPECSPVYQGGVPQVAHIPPRGVSMWIYRCTNQRCPDYAEVYRGRSKDDALERWNTRQAELDSMIRFANESASLMSGYAAVVKVPVVERSIMDGAKVVGHGLPEPDFIIDREGQGRIALLNESCRCGGPATRLGTWSDDPPGWDCNECSGFIHRSTLTGLEE